jgi:hypothetical protein
MTTIYILTSSDYHDGNRYFGAYSSEQKAQEAMDAYVPPPDKIYEGRPSIIVAMPLDQPASLVPWAYTE